MSGELDITKSDDVAKGTAAEAYLTLFGGTKDEALEQIKSIESMPLAEAKPNELFYQVTFQNGQEVLVKVRLIKPELEPSGSSRPPPASSRPAGSSWS